MTETPSQSKVMSGVKECVSFIYVEEPSGEYAYASGTGFHVMVKDEKNPRAAFGYFVTAKHVLLDSNGHFRPQVFVRLNKIAGGVGLNRLILSGESALPICTHPDTTVDLAVIPAYPLREIYAYAIIEEEIVITRDKFKQARITEGDDVFFAGLFAPFVGTERNYPVMRFGHVALLSEEKIPWMNQMLDLYLVECLTYGGNSGSPVFIYKPGIPGMKPLFLAGVVMGSFNESSEVKMASSATPVAYQNMGITAVVPAYFLHEILFSDELRAARASGISIPSR
jgi:hypothetical protein